MDPRDPQSRIASGQRPGDPDPANRPTDPAARPGDPAARPHEAEPVVVRRMDPRLWALLPLIALAIFGAYVAGSRFNADSDKAPGPAVVPPPVVTAPPPPPPRGNITVTEVPHPATVTPPPATTPRPPEVKPAPAPRPATKKPFRQEEPAVVLPPPEPEPQEPEPAIMPPEPPGDTGEARPDQAPAAPSEPDRDPVKLNDPALEYPASAYEDGVEGTTRVGFTVTPDGRVDDAQVSQSSGDSRLDQAALDYVRRLRFRPAIRNGKPSSVRANRNVRFQLR
jgi:protein TonB